MKKWLCLLLVCALLPVIAGAAEGSSGEIRVLLRRLNLSDRVDLTLSGRYLARSADGTAILLSEGAEVSVLLRNHRLILFTGGISADMGISLSLTRQDSGETVPGIRFNLQSGFYPGDLQLSAETSSETKQSVIRPILTLPLETYVQGVVPYEMGDGFPEEALKAQAVCARTYALSRVSPKAEWDVVDTTNDQVFRGLDANSPRSTKAAEDTAGLVLTCDGKLITAWYSASNGGQTELPSNLWTGDVPRCFAMTEDPWDAENPDATVRICTLARDASDLSPAFVKLIRRAVLADPKLSGFLPGEDSFFIQRLTAVELITPRYPSPSRLMTQMKVSFELSPNSDATGNSGEAEDLTIGEVLTFIPMTVTLDLFSETVIALGLSVSGADNEIITVAEDETAFTLRAGRFGHGVGLSQRGAQQMARAGGKDFREILSFYYPGATLKKYTGEPAPLPTPQPALAQDPGPAPTATPRPTLMPVTGEIPEGARIAYVENIPEDSSLNLRAQPSVGAEILLRLYYHQELIVLERSDVPGWVRVKTDTIEGYVMESFLVYQDDEDAPKG